MKTLVTGTKRGLGKFLSEHFESDRLDRETSIPASRYDAVIHSAVSRRKDVDINNCSNYFDDNVSLTDRVLSVPCEKFIYISTVDVYPKSSSHFWKEDDELLLDVGDPGLGIYGVSKFVSESLVSKSNNFLILRCTTLLNRYSRFNTIKQMLDTDNHYDLFVSGASKYNYILVSDLAKFIELAISNDLRGVYNVASSDYICMNDLANELGSDVTFSDYIFNNGKVDNQKICTVAPFFNKTTLEAVLQFAHEIVEEKA